DSVVGRYARAARCRGAGADRHIGGQATAGETGSGGGRCTVDAGSQGVAGTTGKATSSTVTALHQPGHQPVAQANTLQHPTPDTSTWTCHNSCKSSKLRERIVSGRLPTLTRHFS